MTKIRRHLEEMGLSSEEIGWVENDEEIIRLWELVDEADDFLNKTSLKELP